MSNPTRELNVHLATLFAIVLSVDSLSVPLMRTAMASQRQKIEEW